MSKMGNDRLTHPPLINAYNWIMRLNSASSLSLLWSKLKTSWGSEAECIRLPEERNNHSLSFCLQGMGPHGFGEKYGENQMSHEVFWDTWDSILEIWKPFGAWKLNGQTAANGKSVLQTVILKFLAHRGFSSIYSIQFHCNSISPRQSQYLNHILETFIHKHIQYIYIYIWNMKTKYSRPFKNISNTNTSNKSANYIRIIIINTNLKEAFVVLWTIFNV